MVGQVEVVESSIDVKVDGSKVFSGALGASALDHSAIPAARTSLPIAPLSSRLKESAPLPSDNQTPEHWRKCLDVLRKKFDPQLFAAWIEPLKVAELRLTGMTDAPKSSGKDSGTNGLRPALTDSPLGVEVVLSAPNKFSAEHIRSSYGIELRDGIAEAFGVSSVVLKFRVSERSPNAVKSSAPNPQLGSSVFAGTRIPGNSPSDRSANGSAKSTDQQRSNNRAAARDYAATQLNQKYNFSNFIVGGCNQFAHAVSLQVAENLGTLYNPLFVYGGVGLGKTHLVNAIGNASRRRGQNVLMVSSESFVNELISSLRANRMQQFKSKFRSLDVLIIDDVQFIIGKERTQEEFFHTFNELYQHRKQIIVTSDKLPQELTGLEDRLRTRFASGLSVDLQAPDYETRVAILVKKCEGLGVALPIEVAQFIAERIDTNVRELEGALNRVVALASLRESAISLDVAEQAVKGYLPNRRAEISIELIQKIVGERYSVSLSDILGKRRTQNIAFARQVAMYLCRNLTGCSFPEIGALFGGRDHSTVIHAVRVVGERMKEREAFKQEVDALTKRITQP